MNKLSELIQKVIGLDKKATEPELFSPTMGLGKWTRVGALDFNEWTPDHELITVYRTAAPNLANLVKIYQEFVKKHLVCTCICGAPKELNLRCYKCDFEAEVEKIMVEK